MRPDDNVPLIYPDGLARCGTLVPLNLTSTSWIIPIVTGKYSVSAWDNDSGKLKIKFFVQPSSESADDRQRAHGLVRRGPPLRAPLII